MTTDPKTPADGAGSRLDPEPVARRDFLGLAAAGAAGAALAFASVGMARLPRAAVLPSPSKKFRVEIPESLVAGAPFVPPGRSCALFRDATGVWAVSTICTHLGCVVRAEADGFRCPCHGSVFAPDGTVLKGPAPKALPWLRVKSAGGGLVVVDSGSVVPAGTKESA